MICSNLLITTKGRLGTTKDYHFNPPRPEPDPETEKEAAAASTAETAEATEAAALSAVSAEVATADTMQDPAVFLGRYGDRVYRYFPDGTDLASLGTQDPDIDFRQEEFLSEEVRLSLRAQRTCAFKKDLARERIALDVGDVLDIIADLGQIVEFAVFAVCKLFADKSGAVTLTEDEIKAYGERSAAVLAGVKSGDLLLRSTFETPEKMITTIMPRYSHIQQIVRDYYIKPLEELGL